MRLGRLLVSGISRVIWADILRFFAAKTQPVSENTVVSTIVVLRTVGVR